MLNESEWKDEGSEIDESQREDKDVVSINSEESTEESMEEEEAK